MARATKWFMLAAFTLIIGYDAVVATNAVKGDTISEITLELSRRWSVIPLSWGVVVGHLSWPTKKLSHKWSKIAVMWVLGACVLLSNILNLFQVTPIIPVVSGFVLGHFLWAQVEKEDHAWFVWRPDGRPGKDGS